MAIKVLEGKRPSRVAVLMRNKHDKVSHYCQLPKYRDASMCVRGAIDVREVVQRPFALAQD